MGFSDHAALEDGDDDEELGVEPAHDESKTTVCGSDVVDLGTEYKDECVVLENDAGSATITVGENVEAYWPDDDSWLPATIQNVSINGYEILWDEDGTASQVPMDYVRKRTLQVEDGDEEPDFGAGQ